MHGKIDIGDYEQPWIMDISEGNAIPASYLHRMGVKPVDRIAAEDRRLSGGGVRRVISAVLITRDIESTAEGTIKTIESISDTESVAGETSARIEQQAEIEETGLWREAERFHEVMKIRLTPGQESSGQHIKRGSGLVRIVERESVFLGSRANADRHRPNCQDHVQYPGKYV